MLNYCCITIITQPECLKETHIYHHIVSVDQDPGYRLPVSPESGSQEAAVQVWAKSKILSKAELEKNLLLSSLRLVYDLVSCL